jgi:hypothetical protein
LAGSASTRWPKTGATISTRGWLAAMSLAKCSRVQNGLRSAISSRIATSRLPIITRSIPNSGRACVRRACAMIERVAGQLAGQPPSRTPGRAGQNDTPPPGRATGAAPGSAHTRHTRDRSSAPHPSAANVLTPVVGTCNMHTGADGSRAEVHGTRLASAPGPGGKPAESRPSRAGGRLR